MPDRVFPANFETMVTDVTERLQKFLDDQPVRTKLQRVLHRTGATHMPPADDNLRVVDEWPPPARWLTFPARVPEDIIGMSLGPMLPPDGVRDPIYFTVVAVDNNRVGLAYGDYALADPVTV